jgi:hypothetical protein
MPCTITCRSLYLLVFAASSLAISQELKLPDTPETLHIAPAPSDRFPAKWYPRMGDGTDVGIAPVLGKPFEATVESMTPYLSPSGERLQQIERGFKARDRFGRTRSETHNGTTMIDGHIVQTEAVIVSDPVSHCNFNWTQPMTDDVMLPGMRIAMVTCGPQTLRYKDLNVFEDILNATVDGITTSGNTTTEIEHLAPMQINGLAVNRLRVTNSYRAEQVGVKRWSVETWYSPYLKEVIRSGDSEDGYESLTDIRRDDPDPKLFYPPDGYKIMLQAHQ